MQEATLPNMEASIALHLCLWSVGNLGSIFYLYHLPMCHKLSGCSIVFVFGKVRHTVLFSYSISKVSHN